MKGDILVIVLSAMGIFVITPIIFALPVMWLWNVLMPELFGLIQITFWRALEIVLLSNFLFTRSTKKSQ